MAAPLRRTDSRTSTSRGRSRSSSKRSSPSRPETFGYTSSAESQQIDTLLLSSLRYWEVERDLIEERMAAIRSATVPW